MSPEVIGPIMAGIVGCGILTVIGMKTWLNAKIRLQQGAPREEIERLTDLVEGLRDEVGLLRDEFGELHERVDFSERVLSRGTGEPAGKRVSPPT